MEKYGEEYPVICVDSGMGPRVYRSARLFRKVMDVNEFIEGHEEQYGYCGEFFFNGRKFYVCAKISDAGVSLPQFLANNAHQLKKNNSVKVQPYENKCIIRFKNIGNPIDISAPVSKKFSCPCKNRRSRDVLNSEFYKEDISGSILTIDCEVSCKDCGKIGHCVYRI